MKVGDCVKYTEGSDKKTGEPIVYNALVLLVRTINTQFRTAQGEIRNHDHTGANDEPLVTLAFAKERTDASGSPLISRPEELVQIRLDVAHQSHEYSAEEKAYFGKQRYDGGRWRGLDELPPAPPVDPLAPKIEPAKPDKTWGKGSAKNQ